MIHFLKTLNKIFTQNKCDQLLERLLQLESKTRSQKEIILKNIDETKKINELLEEKQIQLEALLLIFAATVVVAAMLLKIILVFKLWSATEIGNRIMQRYHQKIQYGYLTKVYIQLSYFQKMIKFV